MMNTTKITKAQMFAMVLEVLAECESENKEVMVTGIQHELDLLAKKSSSSAKTKNQVENEKIMLDIVDSLIEVGHPVTITELQTESPEMSKYSNQKLSSLLKKLVESGQVVKVVDKKKSYFSLAD